MTRLSSWTFWLFLCTAPVPQVSAAPMVVTDISPTHSLVSMVMDGIEEPTLLIDALSSPHNFVLRPSDANTLARAELIFFTSHQLTPFMERITQSIAANIPTVELLSIKGTVVLPIRAGSTFESHNHQHDKVRRLDSKNNALVAFTDHRKDPHAWLDPNNAAVWLNDIAEQLSNIDPANSSTYKGNAVKAITRINALTENLKNKLSVIQNPSFIVFHDSYHYFESRFNIHASASINLADGSSPNIGKLSSIQKLLIKKNIRCIFSEPQYDDRLVNTVIGNLDIKVATLDPLGNDLTPGKSLYPQLIGRVADNLVNCLSNG